MKVYALINSLIYLTLMTVYKMTLMAAHRVSHINSSQRGLGLVGRCRRAAKSFVAVMTELGLAGAEWNADQGSACLPDIVFEKFVLPFPVHKQATSVTTQHFPEMLKCLIAFF